MTKTIVTLVLTVALFGGIALADDGNMGGTGYTDCHGTNPAPTCTCDPAYPLTCDHFATVPETGDQKVDADLTTVVVEEIGSYVALIF
jgi:hypothetical protein